MTTWSTHRHPAHCTPQPHSLPWTKTKQSHISTTSSNKHDLTLLREKSAIHTAIDLMPLLIRASNTATLSKDWSKHSSTRLCQKPWTPFTRFWWTHFQHQHHLLCHTSPNPTHPKIHLCQKSRHRPTQKSEVNLVRLNVDGNFLN